VRRKNQGLAVILSPLPGCLNRSDNRSRAFGMDQQAFCEDLGVGSWNENESEGAGVGCRLSGPASAVGGGNSESIGCLLPFQDVHPAFSNRPIHDAEDLVLQVIP